MIKEIEALVECEDKEVASKADEICMIHAAWENGDITREMYLDLLEDTKRTLEIECKSNTMRHKSMLLKGVYGILQVI